MMECAFGPAPLHPRDGTPMLHPAKRWMASVPPFMEEIGMRLAIHWEKGGFEVFFFVGFMIDLCF